ncbi:hypothetical protein CC2G_007247 [Coprinopsis cinerea AmutBmut pab1-1]|nr:hypothetical protein CC2G_007247 [Coprinopsis cinerea AmutBmut pab1-1]
MTGIASSPLPFVINVRTQPGSILDTALVRLPLFSYSGMPLTLLFLPSGLHSLHRSDSPFSNASYDEVSPHHAYTLPNSSGSLVDSSRLSPAIRSTFSRWYTEVPIDIMDNLNGLSISGFASSSTDGHATKDPSTMLFTMPTNWLPSDLVETSIENYVQMIAEIQYLLGDRKTLPQMIWDSYRSHPNSKAALTLLNKVYWRRQQHPTQPVLTDSEMHSNLAVLLQELEKGRFDDPDDAIAALHGVSMFLFDGGQGAWRDFLKLATRYVKKVLHNPQYTSPKDALLFATAKDAFIVKTAIWFDVLASITTQEPPTFIQEIRTMFGPVHHGVYNSQFDTDPQCSMMSPMGCENRVVWALAETSTLAHWKYTEDVRCRLSVSDLVIRAQEIENVLYQKSYEPMPASGEDDNDMEQLRFLASEIFRCSTRLFLSAVVNNDHPQVRQIQDLVDECMAVFHNLFKTPTLDQFKVSRSVIRSTVFGIYLVGALTHNRQHREHLLEHIERESRGLHGGVGEGVGNCGSIRKMLEHVWKESDADPAKPVPWRRVLKEYQILLV